MFHKPMKRMHTPSQSFSFLSMSLRLISLIVFFRTCVSLLPAHSVGYWQKCVEVSHLMVCLSSEDLLYSIDCCFIHFEAKLVGAHRLRIAAASYELSPLSL